MILRQKVRASLLFAATTAAMFGCGKSGEQASEIKIVGGQDVPSNQSDQRRWSTVALTTDYVKDQTHGSTLAQNHSFCSGTLVAPRVVITAGHCIDEIDATTHKKTGKQILPNQTDFLVHFDVKVTPEGNWVRAKKVMANKDWDTDQTFSPQPTAPANDIGIIILEKDAPSFARPAAVASNVMANEGAYIAGFGVTQSRNNNDTGTLRQVDIKVKTLDTTGKRIQVGEFFQGACAGDSGGPLYVKRGNGYEVAGATSTGAEVGGYCIGLLNNYTDVTYYKDWIAQQSQEMLQEQNTFEIDHFSESSKFYLGNVSARNADIP